MSRYRIFIGIFLLSFMVPMLSHADGFEYFLKEFPKAICEKMVVCEKEDGFTKEVCLAQMASMMPKERNRFAKSKSEVSACIKAVRKSTCKDLRGVQPKECKFMDDFDPIGK